MNLAMHRVVAEAKKAAGIADFAALEETMQNTNMSLHVGKLVLDQWIKEEAAAKEQKLKEYGEKDLKRFFQVDIWNVGSDGEYPDEDGHEISWRFTDELMKGAHVRVLIADGQETKDVSAMLLKVAKGLDSGSIRPPCEVDEADLTFIHTDSRYAANMQHIDIINLPPTV